MFRDSGWFKSSYSDSGNASCVEVRMIDAVVGVRDSKCPDAGAVWLPASSWSTFVDYSLSLS